MNDEAKGHRLPELLALVLDRLAAIAVAQKSQAEHTAIVPVFDGLAAVTLNAHGRLIRPASVMTTRGA